MVKVFPGETVAAVNGLDFSVAIRRDLRPPRSQRRGRPPPSRSSVRCCVPPAARHRLLDRRGNGTRPPSPRDRVGPSGDRRFIRVSPSGRTCATSAALRTVRAPAPEPYRRLPRAVGLGDADDRRVSVFSGGMRRRANLAAAILHAPRVLLLLTSHGRRRCAVAQPDLRNAEGAAGSRMTIVYTTHYMEEASSCANHRVSVIIDKARSSGRARGESRRAR